MGIFSLELWKPYLFRNEGKVFGLIYISDSVSVIGGKRFCFYDLETCKLTILKIIMSSKKSGPP